MPSTPSSEVLTLTQIIHQQHKTIKTIWTGEMFYANNSCQIWFKYLQQIIKEVIVIQELNF